VAAAAAHGEQPRDRVVGPLELFYDLAVVVLVAQDAHRLAGHLTWPGLAEFAVVFTLVWIARVNGSLALVLLLSIPWVAAVARRLFSTAGH
jgi:low temperature requirement protein LtrA